VARIGSHAFTESDVDSALRSALNGRQLAGESLVRARAEVLAQLMDRYLVEQHVMGQLGAVQPNVASQVAQLKAQLAAQNISFDVYLRERNLTEELLEEQLRWQMLFQEYLERNLTDERLQAYFNQHRREFDGTELRVSHILLRPERAGEGPDAVLKRARQLRKQISDASISFEDAVARYSAGPSRDRGGDLGFIPRHGVMHEAFSQAAFATEKGQISSAVLTPFGAHLIKVIATKPGPKTWRDARHELKEPAAKALFAEIAAAEREKAKIAFTGLMPYFEPGTSKLVKSAENALEQPPNRPR
jgi:peptidyl-prolyl cis-trans isomerase C